MRSLFSLCMVMALGCNDASDPEAGPADAGSTTDGAVVADSGGLDEVESVPDIADVAPADVNEPEPDVSDTHQPAIDDGPSPPLPEYCGPCTPDCAGKMCGDDGCGDQCGECKEWEVCADDTLCASLCLPYCGSKMCGDDGCGGICGKCPNGFECSDSTTCKPIGGGCDGIPEGGMCISGHTLVCMDGAATAQACPYRGCLESEDGAGCQDVQCIPHCFGRTCGDDGCGGTCGDCGAGDACDAALGVCRPSDGCGNVGEAGTCLGHVLARCLGGALELVPCLEKKRLCDPDTCETAVCRPILEGEPCSGVGEAGQCAGKVHFKCKGEELEATGCQISCGQAKVDAVGCK